MNSSSHPNRVSRLKKRFLDVLSGSVKLESSRGAILFLEGLCAQDDPVACLDAIIESAHGLSSVQSAMRFDLSAHFMNGMGSTVLQYLLKASDVGGEALDNLLFHVVEPPIFWGVFVRTFQQGALNEDSQLVFAKVLSRLLTLQDCDTSSYQDIAARPSVQDSLIASSKLEIREMGHLITHILSSTSSLTAYDVRNGPGGRHDNDFADYRDIAILPTADEILCPKPPFLRTAFHDELDTSETPVRDYLDNTFRMLREDMIFDIRGEIQAALQENEKYRGFRVNVSMIGVYTGTDDRKTRWGIRLLCDTDFWQLRGMKDEGARRDFLTRDPRGSKILRHQSLVCLVSGRDIISFGTVNRAEELLACNPPVIVLQLDSDVNIRKTLLCFHRPGTIQLVQIAAAVFSFEPVLAVLKKCYIPLASDIIHWSPESPIESPRNRVALSHISNVISSNPSVDISDILDLPTSIHLDKAQAMSLVAGLQQRVSLIQGPPGTGKSFIGAILAKAIHDETTQTILVVCHTNHALDQFLGELLKYDIPDKSIVRLGGRSDKSTEHLSLHRQPRGVSHDWDIINELKWTASNHTETLEADFKNMLGGNLMAYLEHEHDEFFDAFYVPPETEDGMILMGPGGRAIDSDYLFSRWKRGLDAGMLSGEPHIQASAWIWGMHRSSRQRLLERWQEDIVTKAIDSICDAGRRYNALQESVKQEFTRSTVAILGQKRIIACTTTGAAIYADALEQVGPEVLLVEEAGEILESHILTALSRNVDQMILIGDHKQLRPKVNNYQLTVEKGEGFDLNRSLFERLVLKGYPHVTLSTQHRMRPEISAFVRELTYPELVDGPNTYQRPDIRGVQSNIIFVDHSYPEDEDSLVGDCADSGTKSSKQNTYEVQMVLKIVRYLAQQGYKSEDIAVLTPYLGQLHHLRDALKCDNDPILNYLDSLDLARAGLSPSAPPESKAKKGRIRLATIDNYQGEESDIVIASLTRSNKSNVIGFMDSPQRLNVLLSRARDGLILIGNSQTFLHSRKGGALWKRLFDLLENRQYIYKGFPVKCERHPVSTVLLQRANDFDDHCPDGGCKEPCGFVLACGHTCTMNCHPHRSPGLSNPHDTAQCKYKMSAMCRAGHHRITWECRLGQPSVCSPCAKEAARLKDIARQESELRKKREEAEAEHSQRLAEMEAQLQAERVALAEQRRLQEEREARFWEEKRRQEKEMRKRQEEEEKRMREENGRLHREALQRMERRWAEEQEAERERREQERASAERRERLITEIERRREEAHASARERLIAERQREVARAVAVARAKEYDAEKARGKAAKASENPPCTIWAEEQETGREPREQERASVERRERLIAERQREDARTVAVARAKEYDAEKARGKAAKASESPPCTIPWAEEQETGREPREQERASAERRERLIAERQREEARALAEKRERMIAWRQRELEEARAAADARAAKEYYDAEKAREKAAESSPCTIQ